MTEHTINPFVARAWDDAVWRCQRVLVLHLGPGVDDLHPRCQTCDGVTWAQHTFQYWNHEQIGADDLQAAIKILIAAEREVA